jgi:antitoxin component YwqK of YwqJK toxin-antitoxin module
MRNLLLFCILTFSAIQAFAQDVVPAGAEYREKTYPNGRPLYRGYFRDGQPVGEMKRYYENGVIQAVLNYGDGTGQVDAQMFFSNGNLAAEGSYAGMLKEGTWRYFGYNDKVLTLTETYRQGKRDGPMMHYYLDGRILDSVNWVNDVKQGTWVEYFPDGTLKQKGSFADGKLNGEFVVNHLDGTPYITGRYSNDKLNGKWIFYNDDGTISDEINYVNGVGDDTGNAGRRQNELFRMIEENKGKFEEPDETEFMNP